MTKCKHKNKAYGIDKPSGYSYYYPPTIFTFCPDCGLILKEIEARYDKELEKEE